MYICIHIYIHTHTHPLKCANCATRHLKRHAHLFLEESPTTKPKKRCDLYVYFIVCIPYLKCLLLYSIQTVYVLFVMFLLYSMYTVYVFKLCMFYFMHTVPYMYFIQYEYSVYGPEESRTTKHTKQCALYVQYIFYRQCTLYVQHTYRIYSIYTVYMEEIRTTEFIEWCVYMYIICISHT